MKQRLIPKSEQFGVLVHEVHECAKCPRMCGSARVLNYSAGNLQAELMFVGEAPGRLGADETEIPFHGEVSGRNFEELVAFAGISRSDIFVTNAVLCNPKDEEGNNSTPNSLEIANCANFLRRQIEVVAPKIIVSLGATALKALCAVHPHRLNLKDNVRTIRPWNDRWLIPLYHPGQRAMVRRSFANQRSDYQFVADELRKQSQRRIGKGGVTKSDVLGLAQVILRSKGTVSYFGLHKLAYLAEYIHVRKTGRRMTKAYFIRQKDGPYCTDLQLDRLRRAEPTVQVIKREGQLFLSCGTMSTLGLFEDPLKAEDEIKQTIEETLYRYSAHTDAELKTAVYLTAPMRYMLRRETADKVNLYNAPIDFLASN